MSVPETKRSCRKQHWCPSKQMNFNGLYYNKNSKRKKEYIKSLACLLSLNIMLWNLNVCTIHLETLSVMKASIHVLYIFWTSRVTLQTCACWLFYDSTSRQVFSFDLWNNAPALLLIHILTGQQQLWWTIQKEKKKPTCIICIMINNIIHLIIFLTSEEAQ